MLALPTTYRSNPVIPFMPNADADRAHAWHWAGAAKSIPSGLTIASVGPDQGSESFPLQYTGLSRSEARTLEAFVDSQDGRKTGFWCPTFQQDFYAVAQPAGWVGGGLIFVREWGYATSVFPLGTGYRHFFATRDALRLLGRFNGMNPSALTDPSGFTVFGYDVAGGAGETAGDATTLNVVTADLGLRVYRCLWVRFADDAITTEWTHPHLASVTLRVTAIPGESP